MLNRKITVNMETDPRVQSILDQIPSVEADYFSSFVEIWMNNVRNGGAPFAHEFIARFIIPEEPNLILMKIVSDDQLLFDQMSDNTLNNMAYNPPGLNIMNIIPPPSRRLLKEGLAFATDYTCGAFMQYENMTESGVKHTVSSIFFPLNDLKRNPCFVAGEIKPDPDYSVDEHGQIVESLCSVQQIKMLDLGSGAPITPSYFP